MAKYKVTDIDWIERYILKYIMAKYKVTDIDWDLSSDFDEEDSLMLDAFDNLPQECVVEADDEDDIADALSDEWGFCVNCFGSAELIEE